MFLLSETGCHVLSGRQQSSGWQARARGRAWGIRSRRELRHATEERLLQICVASSQGPPVRAPRQHTYGAAASLKAAMLSRHWVSWQPAHTWGIRSRRELATCNGGNAAPSLCGKQPRATRTGSTAAPVTLGPRVRQVLVSAVENARLQSSDLLHTAWSQRPLCSCLSAIMHEGRPGTAAREARHAQGASKARSCKCVCSGGLAARILIKCSGLGLEFHSTAGAKVRLTSDAGTPRPECL